MDLWEIELSIFLFIYIYIHIWSDVVMKTNGSMSHSCMNGVNLFVHKMKSILFLPLLCVVGSLRVRCLFAIGFIIPVCSTRDEIPFSGELKDSFASMINLAWWLVDWMLLIVMIKSSIILSNLLLILVLVLPVGPIDVSKYWLCLCLSWFFLVCMHLWSRPCFVFFPMVMIDHRP